MRLNDKRTGLDINEGAQVHRTLPSKQCTENKANGGKPTRSDGKHAIVSKHLCVMYCKKANADSRQSCWARTRQCSQLIERNNDTRDESEAA